MMRFSSGHYSLVVISSYDEAVPSMAWQNETESSASADNRKS